MHIACTIGRNGGPSRPSNTGSEGNPLLLRDPIAEVGEVKNREGRTKFGACIFCVLANGVRQLSVECEVKNKGTNGEESRVLLVFKTRTDYGTGNLYNILDIEGL